MSKLRCSVCNGEGILYHYAPRYDVVTMDMAIDAEDRSMAGQEVYVGDEEITEPCGYCNELGFIEREELIKRTLGGDTTARAILNDNPEAPDEVPKT